MPRLNRMWEEFQVLKGRTWVCGLCGESGRVLLDKGDSYYHAFCICPRGRALMASETTQASDLNVLREANQRNRDDEARRTAAGRIVPGIWRA